MNLKRFLVGKRRKFLLFHLRSAVPSTVIISIVSSACLMRNVSFSYGSALFFSANQDILKKKIRRRRFRYRNRSAGEVRYTASGTEYAIAYDFINIVGGNVNWCVQPLWKIV